MIVKFQKVLYIIQVAAMQISEIQEPNVKTTNFFKSNASIDRNGIGIILITSRVFKIIFSFAVKTASIISHMAIIDIMTMISCLK